MEGAGFEPSSWAPKSVGSPLLYYNKRESFQTKGWWQSPGWPLIFSFLSAVRVLRSQTSLSFLTSTSLLAVVPEDWRKGLGAQWLARAPECNRMPFIFKPLNPWWQMRLFRGARWPDQGRVIAGYGKNNPKAHTSADVFGHQSGRSSLTQLCFLQAVRNQQQKKPKASINGVGEALGKQILS